MTVEHEEEQPDTEVSQSNGISHATEEPKALQPEKEKQVATKTEVSSVPDPDLISSVDSDSESGSGSRRANMTRKSRKKIKNILVLNSRMFSFES